MSYESDKPCVLCGRDDEKSVCYHHILTRKTYPEYSSEKWNMISVCQEHHNLMHQKPLSEVAKKYHAVNAWLVVNGWQVSEFDGKWKPYCFRN